MSVLRVSEDFVAMHQKWKDKVAKAAVEPTVPPVVGEANAADGTQMAKSGPVKRDRGPSKVLERDVLKVVLLALKLHPRVAFVWRANAGAFTVGEAGSQRYVRAGFAGQSDILGMLIDGRFLAVECKRPGGGLSQDQHAFLARVKQHGGCAFMAQSVDDVLAILG
jgi:hypothetical protein